MAVVRAMAGMIAHRGPDDSGSYVDGPLALGHRRLSIIDLSSAGHQPMATSDGRYVIAYNGEIYNFKELRATLQARGIRFDSGTDTEVLLYGFAEWGEKVLDRLNGMFAFAIWDTRERRLFLARDRYGVKPLYIARIGEVLLFGSEIKAFLAHPLVLAPDTDRLRALLTPLVERGLDGIEVYYGPYSESQRARLLAVADEFGLLVCGGSDLHEKRPGRDGFGV
ncbi:MAG: hypothetical protein E4H01_15460, partial [Lysobacterales bacterium]